MVSLWASATAGALAPAAKTHKAQASGRANSTGLKIPPMTLPSFLQRDGSDSQESQQIRNRLNSLSGWHFATNSIYLEHYASAPARLDLLFKRWLRVK